jgi:hypothetical protein
MYPFKNWEHITTILVKFYTLFQTHDKNVMFNLNGINISCEDEVKLLGVAIDCKLNFNAHISNICKKDEVRVLVFFLSF